MAIRKVMEGVGGNSFAPEQQITYAEWAKMICITFYSHKMVKGSGSEWYSDYIATVDSLGLFKGTTSYDSSNPLVPATRYDTAEIARMVLRDKKVFWHQDFQRRDVDGYADLGWGEFNINNYASVISDWSSIPAEHKEAVARCYWAGILNGTGDGSFAGDMSLDRAQAAQILNKLIEVCDDNEGKACTTGANLIANKITKGEDRRDYQAVTPVKHVTRLTQIAQEGVREDGEGGFIIDPQYTPLNSIPGMDIPSEGYSTISFTATAGEKDALLQGFALLGDGNGYALIEETIQAGSSKEFSFSITGVRTTRLDAPNGITISDIIVE